MKGMWRKVCAGPANSPLPNSLVSFAPGIVPAKNMPFAWFGRIHELVCLRSMRILPLSNYGRDQQRGDIGTNNLTTDFAYVHAMRLLRPSGSRSPEAMRVANATRAAGLYTSRIDRARTGGANDRAQLARRRSRPRFVGSSRPAQGWRFCERSGDGERRVERLHRSRWASNAGTAYDECS